MAFRNNLHLLNLAAATCTHIQSLLLWSANIFFPLVTQLMGTPVVLCMEHVLHVTYAKAYLAIQPRSWSFPSCHCHPPAWKGGAFFATCTVWWWMNVCFLCLCFYQSHSLVGRLRNHSVGGRFKSLDVCEKKKMHCKTPTHPQILQTLLFIRRRTTENDVMLRLNWN